MMRGSAGAALLPLAAAPILARLYDPADFGHLAVFLAVTTVLGVVAGMRYAWAVLQPESEQAARDVFVLSAFLSAVVGVVVLLATLVLWAPAARLVGDEVGWLPLVAPSVALTGLYTSAYFWMNRLDDFRGLGRARISAAGGPVVVQVVLGLARLGVPGLVVGQVVGQALSLAAFGRAVWRGDLWRGTTWDAMWTQGKRYRDFALYSLPSALVNAVTNQAPVVLLAGYFGAVVVGLFNLATRVLSAPVQVLATAVLDVFKTKATREFRERGECRTAFRRTFGLLAGLALLPFAAIGLVAPWAFEFAFGEPWREAGEYARLLLPFFFLRFVVSPLSFVFVVAERQRVDLAWQVGLFVVTILGLVVGGVLADPALAIGIFSAVYAAMYVLYLWLAYGVAGGRRAAGGA